VPPGQYILQVRGDGPGRTGLFGTQELLVGTEPATLTMPTSYGTNVEGRILFEGDLDQGCTLSSQTAGLTINANCRGGPSSFRIGSVARDDQSREPTTGVIFAGSEFFITNLFGRTALALLSAPGDDWYLKSWTINGTDVADTGYDFRAQPHTIDGSEIVVSRNGAAISGRVSDGARPVDDYFVVAFPVSREARLPGSRRMKFARSALGGTFRVSGLPSGDYFVAAVSRIVGTRDGGEWQNPDVLMQLEARAERITLLEGQAATVSLRLIER
jgi:hypothetical protein